MLKFRISETENLIVKKNDLISLIYDWEFLCLHYIFNDKIILILSKPQLYN